MKRLRAHLHAWQWFDAELKAELDYIKAERAGRSSASTLNMNGLKLHGEQLTKRPNAVG